MYILITFSPNVTVVKVAAKKYFQYSLVTLTCSVLAIVKDHVLRPFLSNHILTAAPLPSDSA